VDDDDAARRLGVGDGQELFDVGDCLWLPGKLVSMIFITLVFKISEIRVILIARIQT